jgi:3'-5' exoribonuclease
MKLMKTPAVRELKPDEIANAVFLVQAKEIRQKRTGEPYLSLTLSDRTGEIEARMWDNVAEIMDTFERDDFIKVRGQLQIYNTRPQFIAPCVTAWRPPPSPSITRSAPDCWNTYSLS